MKALVVGYGSIGQRHYRLLSEAGYQVAVASARDVDVPHLFPSVDPALDEFDPDYVVLANKTHDHYSAYEKLARHGFVGRVLVEKPLFDAPKSVPASGFSRCGVGYNLRFHPLLKMVRDTIAEDRVISAHAYVGQYLPDWRPDSDYRQSASAEKAAGGGVLRDLSHELDFLTWLLGPWRSVTALGGHFSELEIDSDDVFSILFETERCPAVAVHMNYLDRQPRRSIVLQTQTGTIQADLNSGTAETPRESMCFDIDRDATYAEMHRAMLTDGPDDRVCSISEGMQIVEMIDAIERSAKQKIWIDG